MSLLLTGTSDHALLAMAVQEASSALSHGSGYLGRTAIQKIMYFLQVRGVPMRYRFDIHHYGPYCERISRDIDWLIADAVVADRSNNPEKYSNYRPAETADELIARHAAALAPHRELIRGVVKALLPLQPDRLELIAALDFLHRQCKASGGAGPWKEAVVKRFQEVKGDKFPVEEVSSTYDTLLAAGLLR